MERLDKKYSIDEVLPYVVCTKYIPKSYREFDGQRVKVCSMRLQTFSKNGTKCQTCGLEGQYFVLERHKTEPYHLALYGSDGDKEVLLTKRSGVTFCYPCNAKQNVQEN